MFLPKQQKKVSEFKDETIEIRRVTRVVAGGKRFSFRAAVVAGNGKGKVGFGVGKGADVSLALAKAKRAAEKSAFMVYLKEDRTVPCDIKTKYSASKIILKPVPAGHGLIAGGSVRTVLELAGVKDISAKILGRTTNRLTNAKAAIKALKKLKTLKDLKPNYNQNAVSRT